MGRETGSAGGEEERVCLRQTRMYMVMGRMSLYTQAICLLLLLLLLL